MRKFVALIKGFPGHPSHPPLTDVSIGAYTVGTLMLVLGALNVEREQMAHGGLLAISGGLLLALPTALTGLTDWLDLPRGTPTRTTATVHLLVMASATVGFALAWPLQRPGYLEGEVRTGGWLAAVAAELLLVVGGYLGGTIVFVHGHRVMGDAEVPLRQALSPSPPRATHNGGAAPSPVHTGTQH